MSEKVSNIKKYLVGGAVRDRLLGLSPTEKDWVVIGSTAEQMSQLGYKMVGKDFPVFLHPITFEEHALARTERKVSTGHRGFTVNASPHTKLEKDLLRRDLTINAIAQNSTGDIIDPFQGKADLDHRILRHVSPAFTEDPLRVLRVARFKSQLAEFNFTIADQTLELMSELVRSGEISTLSPDRVWNETQKALSSSKPSHYFQALRECGALKVLFPQIDALFGIPQRAEYHPEIDSGIHTMMVVDRASELTNDLAVRFAALIHDLGKALTPANQLPRHIGHEKRGLKPLAEIIHRYPIQNALKRVAEICCEHHLLMHKFNELRPETILKLIQKLDGFRRPEQVEQYILLCQSDSQGRGGMHDKPYPQANLFRRIFASVLQISAKDIDPEIEKGIKMGVEINKIRVNTITKIITYSNNKHSRKFSTDAI